MRSFSDALSWEWKLGREDPMRYDVTINGVDFDFAQHGKNQNTYITILSSIGESFTYTMFRRIDEATTKESPFYANKYYIFSIQRINPTLEKMLNYDNVILVDAEKFFTRDYISFFEKNKKIALREGNERSGIYTI
jgi:hypothetical protein